MRNVGCSQQICGCTDFIGSNHAKGYFSDFIHEIFENESNTSKTIQQMPFHRLLRKQSYQSTKDLYTRYHYSVITAHATKMPLFSCLRIEASDASW